jgi:hypothetical protein
MTSTAPFALAVSRYHYEGSQSNGFICARVIPDPQRKAGEFDKFQVINEATIIPCSMVGQLKFVDGDFKVKFNPLASNYNSSSKPSIVTTNVGSIITITMNHDASTGCKLASYLYAITAAETQEWQLAVDYVAACRDDQLRLLSLFLRLPMYNGWRPRGFIHYPSETIPVVPVDYESNDYDDSSNEVVNACPKLMDWQKAMVRWMVDQEHDNEFGLRILEPDNTTTALFHRFHHRILAARPGLGKTRLIAGMLLSDETAITMVIVPSILLDQWIEQLTEFDERLRARVFCLSKMSKRELHELARLPLPKGSILLASTLTTKSFDAKTSLFVEECVSRNGISRFVVDEYHLYRDDFHDFPYEIRVLMGRKNNKNMVWLISGTPVAFGIFGPHGLLTEDFRELLRRISIRENREDVSVALEDAGLFIPKTRHNLVYVDPTHAEVVAYQAAVTIIKACNAIWKIPFFNGTGVHAVLRAWRTAFNITLTPRSPLALSADADVHFLTILELNLNNLQMHEVEISEETKQLLEQIAACVVKISRDIISTQYPCDSTRRFMVQKWLFRIANNLGYFSNIETLSDLSGVLKSFSSSSTSSTSSSSSIAHVLQSLTTSTTSQQQQLFLNNVLKSLKGLAEQQREEPLALETCIICLEDLDPMKFVQIAKCGHRVCESCVVEAKIAKGKPCPECRGIIHDLANVRDLVAQLSKSPSTSDAAVVDVAVVDAVPPQSKDEADLMNAAQSGKIKALIPFVTKSIAERKHAIIFAEDKRMATVIETALRHASDLVHHEQKWHMTALFGRSRLANLATFRRVVSSPTFDMGVGILITNEMAGIDLPQIRNIFIVQPSIRWITSPQFAVNDEIQLLSRCRRINPSNEECTVTRFIMKGTIEEMMAACYWTFDSLDVKK